MATAFVFLAVLLAGTVADVTVVTVAHNTTVELTCIDPNGVLFPPAWIVNGSAALTDDGYRTSRGEDPGKLIGTLTINGNHTCGTFNVHCRLHSGQIMHNTSLTFGGSLPSPESIHMINSSTIQWNAPYYAMNRGSNFMHVDPHITQYTIYIIDNYTGNCIDKVNITEVSFTLGSNAPDDRLCPLYRVTAWNSGGEGKMSAPLSGYLPHIPNSIAAADVDIHTETQGALHICFNVTDSCPLRRPNSFFITVMSAARVIVTTEQHDHQPGHPFAVRLRLPQNVDTCNLIVRISAGNNAGMSSPIEVTGDCQTTDHTGDLTANTTAPTDVGVAQGSSTQITGVIVGACVTLAMTVVMVTFVLLFVKFKQKREEEKDNIVTHYSQAYDTGTRMSNSRPTLTVPTQPCPAYGVVGIHH